MQNRKVNTTINTLLPAYFQYEKSIGNTNTTNWVKDLLETRSLSWGKRMSVYNDNSIISSTHSKLLPILQSDMQYYRNYIKSILLGQGIVITNPTFKRIGNGWEVNFGYSVPQTKSKITDSTVSTISTINSDPMLTNITIMPIVSGIIANVFNSNVRIVAWRVHHIWLVPDLMMATIGFMSMTMTMKDIATAMLGMTKTYNRATTRNIIATDTRDNLIETNTDSSVSTGYHTGVFMTVAGRTFRTKLTNRKLVVKYDKGRKIRDYANMIDKSRTTLVNRYGTYSITAVTSFTL